MKKYELAAILGLHATSVSRWRVWPQYALAYVAKHEECEQLKDDIDVLQRKYDELCERLKEANIGDV